MTNRLKLAAAFFGVLGVLALGDLVGLILTLRSPDGSAAQLGISRNGQIVRAIVLTLLAAQIALGSLTALAGLLRRRWLGFRMGGLLTATGCVIYGGFQVISAAVQLRSIAFVIIGVVYIGVGLLAFYFARSPVKAAVPE